ncbi:GNAT family N-acetyltransferase [Hahella aquimaris]|uniref:GNAT family N-acetyltransferase n=1 Tax=Hahella sp. HNIBRBA332 TaxID=3015983 RepID=UPI00273AF517|nr:GNAT family N-acetyltransferase [Hahella sp. HNIBRBA332]WLQ13287.1 GNAT family N-acetyltransferase [Hahella sp. HNIBRBA332]
MNIELVSENDFGILKGIAKEAIESSVDVPVEIKAEIIANTFIHIEKGVQKESNVFLKCMSEEVLGFILVQDSWNLSDLFVTPVNHGCGAGRLLLSEAVSKCRPKNTRGYIRVNSSKNAEGFYRKFGFSSYFPSKEVPNFVVPLIYRF